MRSSGAPIASVQVALPGETRPGSAAYEEYVTQAPLPPMPDPNVIALQVSELLTTVLVFAGVLVVARWVLRSPIAEAIGERIRRGKKGAEVPGAQEERLSRLEGDLGAVRAELSEFAERLDFAERILAERRDRRLGAGP